MNTAAQQTVGLIGDPVAQSLSPVFQQAAFDACGLPLRYELWQSTIEQIPQWLRQIRDGISLGANATVPHKEAVAELMDDLSPIAGRIGAVNTIVRDGARLIGDNTDAHGFIVPLQQGSFDFEASAAVVVGAGGASRAVIVALLDAGIRTLTIVNRTPERAERIAHELDDARLATASLAAMETIAPMTALIVNATALGWGSDASPIERAIMERLPDGACAYDLTYRETAFLRAARDAGVATIDGLPMLVHQGARSFEQWTGLQAPVELMWDAAVAARQARGG